MREKISLSSSREAGSSIVAVLVTVGIMGIVAVLYSSGSKSNLQAKQMVEAKKRYSAIESSVVAEASSILSGLTPDACLKSSDLMERPFAFGKVGGKMRFGRIFNSPGNKSSKTIDALARCSSPVLIEPSQINDLSQYRLHFCMLIDQVEAESGESAKSLVEYEVRFVSTSTNQHLSCGSFQKDRSAIAQVAYGIYFVDDRKEAVKQGITIIRSSVKEP